MLGSRKVVEEMRGVVGCGRIARDWEEWEEMGEMAEMGRSNEGKWEINMIKTYCIQI